MMNDLQLYIPRTADGWFYVIMMSDPETMTYNAPWFPPDGCIPDPEKEWRSLQENWIGKEPERFYAFLHRKNDRAFVGDVNYHINPKQNWWDMGVTIYAPGRGKGDGIARLHNAFETTREAAYHIHKAVGFRDLGIIDGIIQLELTKDEYLQHG